MDVYKIRLTRRRDQTKQLGQLNKKVNHSSGSITVQYVLQMLLLI